jgi:hypothetical protein
MHFQPNNRIVAAFSAEPNSVVPASRVWMRAAQSIVNGNTSSQISPLTADPASVNIVERLEPTFQMLAD